MGLRTEFDFVLPKGFVDEDGGLHRHGTMRLATARDEIEPLRDRSISGPDDPYLTVLVLARVVTRLGTLSRVSTGTIEGLFAADLAFLQDLYGIVNFGDPADVAVLQSSVVDAGDDRDDGDAGLATGDDEDVASADDPVDVEPAGGTPSNARRSRIEEVSGSSVP